MILAKEKRHLNKPPTEYKSIDPWADWKPQWTQKEAKRDRAAPQDNAHPIGARPTPFDLQEKHAPTRSAHPHGARRGTQDNIQPRETRRRIVDARLWDAMTSSQQDAACQIASAFEMLGKGLGYAQSNWQRIPGCRGAENVSEAHARMINAYTLWARECAREKISHAMIVDVLCYGFSCKMIDCDRRIRNGATRENLMKGLTLYCRLQGWR